MSWESAITRLVLIVWSYVLLAILVTMSLTMIS
jgi:hypothetical protein